MCYMKIAESYIKTSYICVIYNQQTNFYLAKYFFQMNFKNMAISDDYSLALWKNIFSTSNVLCPLLLFIFEVIDWVVIHVTTNSSTVSRCVWYTVNFVCAECASENSLGHHQEIVETLLRLLEDWFWKRLYWGGIYNKFIYI